MFVQLQRFCPKANSSGRGRSGGSGKRVLAMPTCCPPYAHSFATDSSKGSTKRVFNRVRWLYGPYGKCQMPTGVSPYMLVYGRLPQSFQEGCRQGWAACSTRSRGLYAQLQSTFEGQALRRQRRFASTTTPPASCVNGGKVQPLIIGSCNTVILLTWATAVFIIYMPIRFVNLMCVCRVVI